MKPQTIQKFKNLFKKEKQKLLYSKKILNEDFDLKVEDLPCFTDLTSSELETSMRLRLRNREALYLKKIDAALERIENGHFGLCEECGLEIGIKRLKARPTTTYCVSCKENQERIEQAQWDGYHFKSLGPKLRLA